jgi:predicted alpha-1,6-mannanase (GH76 family)
MMARYYPNTAWLCLRKDVFDRLHRYKVERGIPTWEEAIENALALRETAAIP